MTNQTKIEWCDWTVNPVVGCPHGCSYCYARKQVKRQKQRCQLCYDFVPHPHLDRLEALNARQKPKKIFIDSMWDWNAQGVEEHWLRTILGKMVECSQHTFMILSKRPARYDRFEYPKNAWLGTSVATTADCHRIQQLHSQKLPNICFVSIEPIHEHLNFWFSKKEVDWIILGAETGHRKTRIIPDKEWIASIISNCQSEGIPLFIKNNAGWPEQIRKFPG
jgi:protein gp37